MFRGRRMDLYICKFKQTHAYIDVQVRIMSNYQVMVEEGVDEYLEGERRLQWYLICLGCLFDGI